MNAGWAHLSTSFAASFLASLVEGVEALTVVLAAGSVRGWRSALAGAAAAILALTVLVILLGGALRRMPLAAIQLIVGVLLLLFGLRWLRKAILRAAGMIALHDEEIAYERSSQSLRSQPQAHAVWDTIGLLTSFNIVMLEGTEVVFIVLAVGAGAPGGLVPATIGAVAALLLVCALGFALRRPLERVPENSLKFAVGVLLSAFGSFWVGEGLHLRWPGADWSLPVLVLAYLVVALLLVRLVRTLQGRTEAAEGRL